MSQNRLGMLGVVALILLASSAVSASEARPGGQKNPRTGRPIVTRSGAKLSGDALRALARARGFADVEKAVFLAQRESGGDAGIVLDTRGMTPDELLAYWKRRARPELSVGLWQINLLANGALVPGDTLEEKVRALQDPATNADVAFHLSRGGTSWGPWGG